jgi:cytochrome c5
MFTMSSMSRISTFAKHSLVLSLFAGWLVSCGNQKARNTSAPFDPVLPFKPVKTADNKLHSGYALYVKHCYQCHQQAHPATLSFEKWENTVPRMAKHAGISEADGKDILDYILQMKSQGVH